MKCIGLVGGVSWASTLEYYKRLNLIINKEKGKNHSAKIILYSFDFEEILQFQKNNNEVMELRLLEEKINLLDKAGSDVIAVCSNTTNKLVERLQKSSYKKLINVIDATGNHVRNQGIKKVGLLGTKYTMEFDFYKRKLAKKGIEVITPDLQDRDILQGIIYEELCKGIVMKSSRAKVLEIINRLADIHALNSIILGCTELPLLISKEDVEFQLFDTIDIHIQAILKKINFSTQYH
ncbi:aspartate/glutamate racemase family protein [Legionella waltersii]|uniref:Aspartate racemase n=1 Tax=Legionella waltersii TaxID=66969 RepID=A0A0W1ADL9_9GAMM|nr:amino acid racemase [Legionella waltersii]KTD79423.1 Aspartate racemase [Legionella waltersii]SNU97730.1 putative racemase [Legionella waltersii]